MSAEAAHTSVPNTPLTPLAVSDEQHALVLHVKRHNFPMERVLGVLRRRAPNVATLSVASTEDPDVARVTIVLHGSQALAEHAAAHLRKVVDVASAVATPVTAEGERVLLRELALVRIACTAQTRREVVDIAQLFGACVVDVGHEALTLEVCGTAETIDNVLRLLATHGIRELTRTGRVAIHRDG